MDQISQILAQALIEVAGFNRDVDEVADRLATLSPRQRELFAERLQDALREWGEAQPL